MARYANSRARNMARSQSYCDRLSNEQRKRISAGHPPKDILKTDIIFGWFKKLMGDLYKPNLHYTQISYHGSVYIEFSDTVKIRLSNHHANEEGITHSFVAEDYKISNLGAFVRDLKNGLTNKTA